MGSDFHDWFERGQRRPVRLLAAARWADGTAATVELSNMSYGGCQLRSKHDFEKGETVYLMIPDLGKVRAQIRWVKDGRAGARFITGDSAQDSRRARIGV